MTLIDNWDEVKKRVFETTHDENACEAWEDNRGNKYDPRDILRRYKLHIRNGHANVKYINSAVSNAGRKFALRAEGLQSFSRPIRHTLSAGLYQDIDIVNCHPAILVQYCEKKGYACECIKDYVENRQARLEDLMTANGMEINKANKEVVKKVMLSAVNGSIHSVPACIKDLKVHPRWFTAFFAQCRKVKEQATTDKENGDLVKAVQKKQKKDHKNNLEGSVLNHVLCRIEDSIIMECVAYCEANNITVKNVVLCFDGFMIPAGLKIDLEELQVYVKEHTTYEVRFDVKPFDEVVDLAGLMPNDSLIKEAMTIENDAEAAIILLKELKDRARSCGGVIYMKEKNLWITDATRVNTLMLNECVRMNFVKMGANDAVLPYSTNAKGRENIVKIAKDFLVEQDDPDFEKKLFESTKEKLCFKNGVYDFNTKAFRPWDESKDVLSTIQINRDFPVRDEAKIKEVYDKVLNTIFDTEDKRDSFLACVACAVAGLVNEKYFAMGLGHRNSGKGVLTELCEHVFEEYTGTILATNFLMDCKLDPERQYAFLLLNRYKRLVFANEAKRDDSRKDCSYDGTLLKSAIGGDTYKGRVIYGATQSFKIQSKFFFMFNDMPSFSPADCLESMKYFDFPYKFVDAAKMVDGLPFYRLRDASIKDYIKEPAVCDAFLHIVFDNFAKTLQVSKGVEADGTAVLMECGDEETVFKNAFTMMKRGDNTLDESFAITSADVHTWTKSLKMNISTIRIKKLMEGMGFMYSCNKRIGGKQVGGFFGVKWTKEMLEDEDDE